MKNIVAIIGPGIAGAIRIHVKKSLLLIAALCLLMQAGAGGHQDGLERIRANYAKAPSEKAVCRAMIEELSRSDSNALHLAYLGAFRAIWAKHTFNPIAKLVTFNKGKDNIEKAVMSDPDNVEIRFVRLSIQQNCPSFLGYNNHVQSDRQFIYANKQNVRSRLLREMIANILQ